MEAGVPLGEFWAVGKTGQGHGPAPAFPLPRPQDVSPCACSLSGPGFGRKVQRPRFLPAPGRMLLPLQACPARGPISAQRFPTRHAERASQTNQRRKPTNVPSRSDQRSRKAAQSGLAFLLVRRPDARSPLATAANSNGCQPGQSLCAGAERGQLHGFRSRPASFGNRGGDCVMASRAGVSGGGKRRRENGGAGQRWWYWRVRGPGRCSRPQQGPRQRRPLRAAVVRTQAIHDGARGRVGGRAAGCVSQGGAEAGVHSPEQSRRSRGRVQWVII